MFEIKTCKRGRSELVGLVLILAIQIKLILAGFKPYNCPYAVAGLASSTDRLLCPVWLL